MKLPVCSAGSAASQPDRLTPRCLSVRPPQTFIQTLREECSVYRPPLKTPPPGEKRTLETEGWAGANKAREGGRRTGELGGVGEGLGGREAKGSLAEN